MEVLAILLALVTLIVAVGGIVWTRKDLEKKISNLDPEKVSERLRAAIEELNQWKKKYQIELERELEKALNEKASELSNKVTEQNKRIDEFIALSKRNAVKVMAGCFELIRRTLGITEQELEQIQKEEKKAIKQETDEGAKG